ncbi:MAG: DEAD/DEAH box helicase [Myxococcota bacterium]|nr:DEAD/DEAH box helicase [Myxococcota bacterium]
MANIRSRPDDYYISLVGELFERMRTNSDEAAGWALLGNALADLASRSDEDLQRIRILRSKTALFAATAFYCGGFPASAYLTLKTTAPNRSDAEAMRACFDLMRRPKLAEMTSDVGQKLVRSIRRGDEPAFKEITGTAVAQASDSLAVGPDAWIPARLFEKLTERLLATNVRTVLPDGWTPFWTPFVESLLNRGTWEFFPSQIEAIERGLLVRNETYSLQMPTGAGKTALCETLLFHHAKTTEPTPNERALGRSKVALFLVPLRSLASELRNTVVKRLNRLGVSARCAYGGTIPTNDEKGSLDQTRVIVATPEALLGLLGASVGLLGRISLVICDEGHLLDGGGRGVSLELLLTRLRARENGPPRFVFVSAIVPNIEEINAWLGGSDEDVVRSDYRPAIAEYATLRHTGAGVGLTIDLVLHPHEQPPVQVAITNFLSRTDFEYLNPLTGRRNTYPFESMNTRAISAGRKALPMGAVALFAANKRGDQGAIGLAEKLIDQLSHALPLPKPIDYAVPDRIRPIVQYLTLEYGPNWLGTRMTAKGAILHHGDIPQEAREVVEGLLRAGGVRFVICTSTLAEGVNLPIRTLVLYSVHRRTGKGPAKPLLTRDIKNLVGRAGRAGATTKGLVICANPNHWEQVECVARQDAGEPVQGALYALIERMKQILAQQSVELTNDDMEASHRLHTLIDGIDATLIDLATDEIGEDVLVLEARRIASETFAAQGADDDFKAVLDNVFELRARRVASVGAGRLGWLRETGARLRIIDSVEKGLLPKPVLWETVADPLDPTLVDALLEWVWKQADVQEGLREAHRKKPSDDLTPLQAPLFQNVKAWLRGERFQAIARATNQDLDDVLGVHGRVVSYVLQVAVEQGVALLAKFLEEQERELAPAVVAFPEHLRFGVPTPQARILAVDGLRHRSAAVELGNALQTQGEDRDVLNAAALNGLREHEQVWRDRLGDLVYENTLTDLGISTPDAGEAE